MPVPAPQGVLSASLTVICFSYAYVVYAREYFFQSSSSHYVSNGTLECYLHTEKYRFQYSPLDSGESSAGFEFDTHFSYVVQARITAVRAFHWTLKNPVPDLNSIRISHAFLRREAMIVSLG